METVYGFEISDGDSWRLSETTLTTSSQSDLTTRMKPAYLDDTLHWLRNDGSIIAFNPETEQARLIPSRFHRKPDMKLLFAEDEINGGLTLISGTNVTLISVYTLVGNHKWELKRRISNVSNDRSSVFVDVMLPTSTDFLRYTTTSTPASEVKSNLEVNFVENFLMGNGEWGKQEMRFDMHS